MVLYLEHALETHHIMGVAFVWSDPRMNGQTPKPQWQSPSHFPLASLFRPVPVFMRLPSGCLLILVKFCLRAVVAPSSEINWKMRLMIFQDLCSCSNG